MIELIFTGKNLYKLIILFFAIIFFGFQSASKLNDDIILHDSHLSVIPKEFYITNVIDERDSRNTVGWLLSAAKSKKEQPQIYPVDFHGGAAVTIKEFISRNLQRNAKLHPIIISIKKLSITESAAAYGGVKGNIDLVMLFNLDKDSDKMVPLATYTGDAVYTRSIKNTADVEAAIRLVIGNAMEYLNTWMNEQVDINIKLAKGVKVVFTEYDENTEGDSIYYKVNRPLKWSDFESKIPSGKYAAEVFPVIGYDEHNDIKKGIVNVRLKMKVCLPKSGCWVKEGSRNDYILNHEQRHFDIVKLVEQHFIKKILIENLPVDNYDGTINLDYLDAYREMDKIQKQYDDETHHGLDQSAQEDWNRRIDKELKEYGVK